MYVGREKRDNRSRSCRLNSFLSFQLFSVFVFQNVLSLLEVVLIPLSGVLEMHCCHKNHEVMMLGQVLCGTTSCMMLVSWFDNKWIHPV
jgi:hypothetical protein